MESDKLRELIDKVTDKRPRTVLQHILMHGRVTTAELRELYGYDHPPRAARDVREQGIPLKTIRVPGPTGRMIGAYVLGDEDDIDAKKSGGRRQFPKSLKVALVAQQGETCALCGASFPSRALQIDHRVPYEVVGEQSDATDTADAFMLVCGSCNRAKSWSCEHCENWLSIKDPRICMSCMWGSPERYDHIAMEQRRSVQLQWRGDDVEEYEALSNLATEAEQPIEDYIKRLIRSKLTSPKE